MATFLLIHGGGDSGSTWGPTADALHELGHRSVAVDLPITDESSTLTDYVDTAIAALPAATDAGDVVVVGHSLGGLTAPLVAERIRPSLLVMLTAMVARAGETGETWWGEVGFVEPTCGEAETYFHDVAPDMVELARRGERSQAGAAMSDPYPLDAWPDVPTRFVLCTEDRLFPADWMRGVIRDRLGITEPDEFPTGHMAQLARPVELAALLDSMTS